MEKADDYPFLLAKVNLRLALHDYHDFSLEDSEVKQLENAVVVFEKFKSWKLAARGLHLMSQIYKNEPE
jgi:hypothetical protein